MSGQVQQIQSIPDMAVEGGGVARVPVNVLNLAWVYTHVPTAWQFVGTDWLPELGTLCFRDGLNGQSGGNIAAAKTHAQSKGCVIIEPTNPKLGPYKNYRHKLPAYDPNSGAVGTYYGSMWEQPTVVGGRNVRWTHDDAGHRAFLKHLVTSGIIEPISKVVAEGKIDHLAGELDHLRALPASGQRAQRIAAMEKQLEAMQASLDWIQDDFEDEPEMVVKVEKNQVRTRIAPKETP